MIEFLHLCEKYGLTTNSMTSTFNIYQDKFKSNNVMKADDSIDIIIFEKQD